MRLFVFAVVVALLLAFVLAPHSVEGLSMWPALEGSPIDAEVESDRETDWLLVVDKLSPLFSRPDRFQICVFRQKGPLSVKRLAGLPGETIDFRGGDLFIGRDGADAERVARPAALIERQMVPVPPIATAAPILESTGRSEADGNGTVWKPRPGQTLTVFVRYGAGSDPRCITDDHVVVDKRGPNGRVAPGRHAVPDVRVTVGPIAVGEGSIAFIHEIGLGEIRRVVVSAAGIEISSKVGGVDSVIDRFPEVNVDGGLRFETIDGLFRVSLRHDGAWLELFSHPRDTEHHEGYSGVRFEVTGAPVRVGPLEVARDVHYVWGAETPAGYRSPVIPPDRMFLIGDNPEFSTDSRSFGPVPFSALVGVVRAVLLPWSRKRVPL